MPQKVYCPVCIFEDIKTEEEIYCPRHNLKCESNPQMLPVCDNPISCWQG